MRVVILCGGSGTRLWPISRKTSPKQFAKIFEEKSLFQLTVLRNSKLATSFIVVVNRDQYDLCKSQWDELNLDFKIEYILEPVGKNTAPAIALACLATDQNDDLLIIPSDHLINNQDIYDECIKNACKLSQENNLVTFGIKAKYPETGYGYIEADGINVKSFKEKPDLTTAIQYVSKGNYFWNSGMFCFTAKTFLNALEKFSNEIFIKSKIAFKNTQNENGVYRISLEDMNAMPSDSIDYAVMERANNTKVIPSPFEWSDLGSFDSLYEELSKDEFGNTPSSKVISVNSTNNLILSGKRIITTFDVSDLVIVDTDDAILIGKKGKSQNVKKIVEKLQELKSNLLD